MLELVIIVILSILLVYSAFVIIDQRKVIKSLRKGFNVMSFGFFQDLKEMANNQNKPTSYAEVIREEVKKIKKEKRQNHD